MRANAEKEKWLVEQVAIQETSAWPRSIGLAVSGDDIFTWPEGIRLYRGQDIPPSLVPGENIFILEPASITPTLPDGTWLVEWRIYGPIAEAA